MKPFWNAFLWTLLVTGCTFIPYIVSSIWIDWYSDVKIDMGNLWDKMQNSVKHGTFLFLSVSMGGGAFSSFVFRHKCAHKVKIWAERAAYGGICLTLPTLLFLYPVIKDGNAGRNLQMFTVGMFIVMILYTFSIRKAIVNGLPAD